jgi:hypothetical protein
MTDSDRRPGSPMTMLPVGYERAAEGTSALRVTVTLSFQQANLVTRLCRTGMFGGPNPTIASVVEEVLRLKLREIELEGWGEER